MEPYNENNLDWEAGEYTEGDSVLGKKGAQKLMCALFLVPVSDLSSPANALQIQGKWISNKALTLV